VLASATWATPAWATEKVFESTGEQQEFKVPAGVSSIHVTAIGAAGGQGNEGAAVGRGAVVSGQLSVKEGATLYVLVGGAGGFNGGGFNGGGGAEDEGGGGGGASDVRTVSDPSTEPSLKSRIIVAAGGGGAGGQFAGSEGAHCADGHGGDAEEPGATGGNCGYPSGTGGGAGQANKGGAGGTDFLGGGEFGGANEGGLGSGSGGSIGGGGGGGGLFGGGGGGAQGEARFDPAELFGGAGGGGGGSNLVPKGGSASIDENGAAPSVTITYTVPSCSKLVGYGHISPSGKTGENLVESLSTNLTAPQQLTMSTSFGEKPPYASLGTLEEAGCVKSGGEARFSGRGSATVKGKAGYSMSFAFKQTGAQMRVTLKLTKGASTLYSATEALISDGKNEKIS
jgi:hypothetical protein